MGNICCLGSANCFNSCADGRIVSVFTHLASALGRVPVEVLQRRRLLVCAIFFRRNLKTGRSRTLWIKHVIFEHDTINVNTEKNVSINLIFYY